MQLELTSNGILYDWWLASRDGASFHLYPIKQRNFSEEDIRYAKAEIRRDRDVVGRITKTVLNIKECPACGIKHCDCCIYAELAIEKVIYPGE